MLKNEIGDNEFIITADIVILCCCDILDLLIGCC